MSPRTRNVLGVLRVELRPHVVAFADGSREFHVDIRVGTMKYESLNYVLSDDEMVSRFDQLFDIAREQLRREILRHQSVGAITEPA
jgi:hypothetical protein